MLFQQCNKVYKILACHKLLGKSLHSISKNKYFCYSTKNYKSLFNTIYDADKFTDSSYIEELRQQLSKRKGNEDLDLLHNLFKSIPNAKEQQKIDLIKRIQTELRRLPNESCPVASKLSEPETISEFGTKIEIDGALTAEKMSVHGIETDNYGYFAEDKSYSLRGSMARLQHKLVRYTVRELLKQGFTLISVPDLVTRSTLRDCGAPVDGERTMVYHLDPSTPGCGEDDICLSGTAEMALGGWLKDRVFEKSELPLKLCSVSRCYRVEATRSHENRGIFRVHSFFKVEMFGITTNETGRESEDVYKQLVDVQQKLLKNLGLHGQVVLMPPSELGNPAYSKIDLEVWMPGRKVYGELTSASNCTSYQASRLGAKYRGENGSDERYVHTVNGTAMAMPRCIIALCETHQETSGRRELRLPSVLGVGKQSNDNLLKNEGDNCVDVDSVQLEKIMTYNEKCARRYINNDFYKGLLVK